MTLLGIKNVKEAKSNEIVSQNLTSVLASLSKKDLIITWLLINLF